MLKVIFNPQNLYSTHAMKLQFNITIFFKYKIR